MKLYHKIALLPVAIAALFAFSPAGSPAQAQGREREPDRHVQTPEAVELGHQILRDKILHEAHDRFDVRFITTDVESLGPGGREVTGRGIFRRHGKSSQRFSYHVTVRPREGDVSHAGYDIR